jgi:hypothetical protein
MITITFIAAVITGVFLAVKICRLPETKEAVRVMLAEKPELKIPLVSEMVLNKDYFLAKKIIKC